MRPYKRELGLELGEGQKYSEMLLGREAMVGDEYFYARADFKNPGKLLAIRRRFYGQPELGEQDILNDAADVYDGKAKPLYELVNTSAMRHVLKALGFSAVQQSLDFMNIKETRHTITLPSVRGLIETYEAAPMPPEHRLPRIVPFHGNRYKRRECTGTLAEGGFLLSTGADHDMLNHLAGMLAVAPLCMRFLQARGCLARDNDGTEPELAATLMEDIDGGIIGWNGSAPLVKLGRLIRPDPRIRLPTDIRLYEDAQRDRMRVLDRAFNPAV